MNKVNVDQVSSLIRSAFKLFGGALATNGINKSSVTQIVCGVVTTLIGMAWSHWEHSDSQGTTPPTTPQTPINR